MNILALDLATVTGWAWGDSRSTPVAGFWKLPGMSEDKRPASFASIYAAVQSLVRGNSIGGVIMETPAAGFNSAHTTLSLTMLAGAAQAGAINGGAKVMNMIHSSSWRKQVLGKGKLNNPKLAALDYCRMHRWHVTDHNAAEACCIWQYAHGVTNLLDRIKEG